MMTDSFRRYLEQDCGYFCITDMPDGRYAAVMPLIMTHAIIIGHVGDRGGYDDRWCYHSRGAAEKALAEWEKVFFAGEPAGWHRHPFSGRRRPDGDASKEYVEY